jgi:hypothetical protein
MMNINKAIELFNTLVSKTNKESEKKVYNCFVNILFSLKNKGLTERQSILIEEKLTSLNLKQETKNSKKFYKQKLSEFKTFLKNEFSFTTEKHYTELGMIYGMIYGPAIGLSIGTAISSAIGISIGLSIGSALGMVFGMIYGASRDTEAKKQGKVI